MKNNSQICFKLPRALRDKAKAKAEAEERTIPQIIRTCLRKYVNEGNEVKI